MSSVRVVINGLPVVSLRWLASDDQK